MSDKALKPSVRNVLRVYRSATFDQLRDGSRWYERANELATALDPADPARAAAVIAVLSPRISWDLNVRLAQQTYAGQRPKCLSANAEKAVRIYSGEEPNDIVRGAKVRAFWRAITDPTDAEAIVVDRHAIDIAVGRVLDDAQRGALLGRAAAYGEVAECYRKAALRLTRTTGTSVSPVDVQATTWVVWRDRKRKARA